MFRGVVYEGHVFKTDVYGGVVYRGAVCGGVVRGSVVHCLKSIVADKKSQTSSSSSPSRTVCSRLSQTEGKVVGFNEITLCGEAQMCISRG